MSSRHLPDPESEYGYTLRQVEVIVGTELMPEFREHMMMRAHVLDGPDGEVFYPFDVLQFVERSARSQPTTTAVPKADAPDSMSRRKAGSNTDEQPCTS